MPPKKSTPVNDRTQQALHQFEYGNPAWQSNSLVGSRRRVFAGEANYTWKFRNSRAGITRENLKKEVVQGYHGFFNRSARDSENSKTKIKSIAASEGANLRNSWVKYVKKCGEAFLQRFKISKGYPAILADPVTQLMYNAVNSSKNNSNQHTADPFPPKYYPFVNLTDVVAEFEKNDEEFELVRNRNSVDIMSFNPFDTMEGIPNPFRDGIIERYENASPDEKVNDDDDDDDKIYGRRGRVTTDLTSIEYQIYDPEPKNLKRLPRSASVICPDLKVGRKKDTNIQNAQVVDLTSTSTSTTTSTPNVKKRKISVQKTDNVKKLKSPASGGVTQSTPKLTSSSVTALQTYQPPANIPWYVLDTNAPNFTTYYISHNDLISLLQNDTKKLKAEVNTYFNPTDNVNEFFILSRVERQQPIIYDYIGVEILDDDEPQRDFTKTNLYTLFDFDNPTTDRDQENWVSSYIIDSVVKYENTRRASKDLAIGHEIFTNVIRRLAETHSDDLSTLWDRDISKIASMLTFEKWYIIPTEKNTRYNIHWFLIEIDLTGAPISGVTMFKTKIYDSIKFLDKAQAQSADPSAFKRYHRDAMDTINKFVEKISNMINQKIINYKSDVALDWRPGHVENGYYDARTYVKNIPEQNDGFNCGVYAIIILKMLLNKTRFNEIVLNPRYMTSYRRILANQLLSSSKQFWEKKLKVKIDAQPLARTPSRIKTKSQSTNQSLPTTSAASPPKSAAAPPPLPPSVPPPPPPSVAPTIASSTSVISPSEAAASKGTAKKAPKKRKPPTFKSDYQTRSKSKNN